MHSPGDNTGLRDSMGREIRLGDLVLDAQGFEGVVVFVNGAYRYDVAGGHYLTFHSSLIFGDGEGSRRLTVIRKPVGHDQSLLCPETNKKHLNTRGA